MTPMCRRKGNTYKKKTKLKRMHVTRTPNKCDATPQNKKRRKKMKPDRNYEFCACNR